MAEADSVQACIDRHLAYPYDIAHRLKPAQRHRVAEMVRPVRPGELVLDVGCNSGYLIDFLPATCIGWGVDVAPELVARARLRLARAEVAPAETLPFPDSSVDVVVLGEILEHVFDPVAVVREAARVARRLVIGSTPHEASPWGPQGSRRPEGHRFHVRCFTATSLGEVLCQAGCMDPVVEVTSWEGVPQFYCFEAAAAWA